jgi:two-component system response regulator FlrC
MKTTVLLVEDNAATRFGFTRYFSKGGYEIVEAGNLSEAAIALATHDFKIMILDVNLPDGRGIDFLDTVRTSDPGIAIIVITGAGDIPLAVEAMQRGADNFLIKPIDNAALELFMRKSLEISLLKQQQFARKRLEKKMLFLLAKPEPCRRH